MAETLTKHLREVCKDKHLGVRYYSEPLPTDRTAGRPRRSMKQMRRDGGAAELRVQEGRAARPGGVGLLELEGFMPADLVGDTAAAAMSFLANSEAVIVDLRKNGGGNPGTVILLCSYFFDESTHLNSIYTRTTDTTRQYWSQPVVPGKKLRRQGRVRADQRPDVLGGGGVRLQPAVAEARHDRRRDDRRRGAPDARLPRHRPLRRRRAVRPVDQPGDEDELGGDGREAGRGGAGRPGAPAPAHLLALKKAAEKYASDKDKPAAIQRDLETVNKELDALKAKAEGAGK